MKRLSMALISLVVMIIGMSQVFANQIAIVDMQQIFQTAPQVKKINDALQKQFSSRREEIVAKGKTFQDEVQKYQKDKTVMSSKDSNATKDKLTKEENDLRQLQAKYQQDLYAAQNQNMNEFMKQVKDAVKSIAMEKKLDVAIPKNSILYASEGLDITQDVLKKLK